MNSYSFSIGITSPKNVEVLHDKKVCICQQTICTRIPVE